MKIIDRIIEMLKEREYRRQENAIIEREEKQRQQRIGTVLGLSDVNQTKKNYR